MRHAKLIVLLAALLLVPVTANASVGPPEGPVHVALGDSQAFGIGTHTPEKLGYNAFLSRFAHSVDCRDALPAACPGLDLVNLSVPGATSSSLIADQLQPALTLVTDRNNDADPGNDVVLVTLTIGGNDLFAPIVSVCIGQQSPNCPAVIAGLFAQYANNLNQILSSLRSAAGPDTQIVVSTYENALDTCFLAPFAAFGDLVLEGGQGVPIGFNDIIRTVAAASDVAVADVYGQTEDEDWVGGQDCNHLDTSGYHRIAQIFRDAID